MFKILKSKQRPVKTDAPVMHVGPWPYSVSISPGPLVADGEEVMVAWLEDSREIVLSADCPPAARMGHVMYSLMRGWINHTGIPGDECGWCDLAATALEAAYHDLMKCGGADALHRLQPGEALKAA